MSLENIFSEENMLAYAGACVDLAVDIPERAKDKPFDTLLIPSRGAVPFFLGMNYALHKFTPLFQEHKDFHDNLGVEPMLEPLMGDDFEPHLGTDKKRIRTLLIPFTADLNIPEFDPSQDNEDYITKTRKYWTNVAASFAQHPKKRGKDPYFTSFLDVILRGIESRRGVAESYASFPRASQFSMIDTVISGRASSEILEAFDELAEKAKSEDLISQAYLIVDENGRKLRGDLKPLLNMKKAVGQLRMYEIPRIVSEDEGASLEGVAAVVYPSVMRVSKDLTVDGDEFFVGAGSWHIVNSYYLKNFKRFMEMVCAAIDAKFASDYEGPEGRPMEKLERFREERERFLGHANKADIMSRVHKTDVSILKLDSHYVPSGSYETSSHVVHIPFIRSSTDNILTALCRIPEVRYKETQHK